MRDYPTALNLSKTPLFLFDDRAWVSWKLYLLAGCIHTKVRKPKDRTYFFLFRPNDLLLLMRYGLPRRMIHS